MSSIQLLIEDSAERAAVSDLVHPHYDIKTETETLDADLFLVDEQTFPTYHTELKDYVQERHPRFCPVVLIRRPSSLVDVSLPPSTERDPPLVVDEVLEAPLRKATTIRRLDSLLIRQQQSGELHQTVRDLEEANKRLEQMASVLTHDLRNPLQVAQIRLSLLQQEYPEASTHTGPLARAIERMEDLIEKLVTITRTGEEELTPETVILEDVAEAAWAHIDTDSTARTAQLRVADGAGRAFHADETYLLQVFENLFRNAIEHASGDVTITVGSLCDGFYVEDTGPGIPPEERTEVLRMGYSTSDDGNANGLGLNIVAEVVDVHGWELTITEGTSGGARFEVRGISFASEYRSISDEC